MAAGLVDMWKLVMQCKNQQYKAGMRENLNATKQFADGSNSILNASFASLAGFALKIAGPISAIGALKWGVELASQAESAQVGFATMLGSAGKAQTLLKEITTFANSTPFEAPQIRDAARSLLSFGVDASEVMTRIKTLGDVASGSQSDIKDLALIYGKTLAKGKFELEQGNQLAERGIPIYSTLAKQLGVTKPALMKMISAGKITADQVQKAFESMSSAGGIFDNAMEKQSHTVAGMWSSTVDAVGSAMTDVGQMLIDAFHFKDIMVVMQSALGWIKDQLAAFKPVLTALVAADFAIFTAIGQGFMALANMIKPALQPIIDYLGSVFGTSIMSFRDNILSFIYAVHYVVEHMPDVWDIAVTQIALDMETMYQDMLNIFGTLIPTIFTSFSSATMGFFYNLGKNIGSAMREIWDYITSRGKNKIEMTWTPLSDGFAKAMDDIAKASTRKVSDVEKILKEELDKKRSAFGEGLGAFVEKKMDELKKVGAATAEALDKTVEADQPFEEPAAKGKRDSLGALNQGSIEAFKAIAEIKKDSNPVEKAMQENNALTKETNEILKRNAGGVLLPANVA